MVRALLAYDRGDAAVLSRVPSVEEEDRKRLLRERQRLVKERTALTNAIKGLLKLHGYRNVPITNRLMNRLLSVAPARPIRALS